MTGSPDKLDFRSDDFRPYAIALGEMSLAWNDLHERLAALFWAALGIRNGLIPFSVWYSSKYDRAQRDMLRSLAITPAIDNIGVAPLSWTVLDLRAGGVAAFVVDG